MATTMFALLIVALCTAQVKIEVDAGSISHQVNPFILGCHSDSGYTHQPRGLYSQMVIGESFENPPGVISFGAGKFTLGLVSFMTLANPGYAFRHCGYQAYSHTYEDDNQDFLFRAVPAINGAKGAVSFGSTNFPGRFITVIDNPSVEATRLGIVEQTSGFDLDTASFAVEAGQSDSSLFSFRSLSKQANLQGMYIAINDQRTGVCSRPGDKSSSDVVLCKNCTAVQATWKMFFVPPPVLPWVNSTTAASATIAKDATAVFNNRPTMRFTYSSGPGVVAMSNRGLGSEGLYFEGGKPYEGYFFVKSAGPVTLFVSIDNRDTNSSAARLTIPFAGGNWTMMNFTLTPAVTLDCKFIAQYSDPTVDCGHFGPGAGHACVKCAGQFTIGLSAPGSANIEFVFLQPGSWGRYKDLPVLLSAVQTLQAMGVSIIRQGGSYADDNADFWTQWRGPRWARPSLSWEWGASLVSGWGPFEMIDLCNAAGIEPVMTTNAAGQRAYEMANLVEYCYGDSSTTWGALRIADGHPEPYKVRIFELGNEQYNAQYVDQVIAMEQRATQLGMPKQLYYMFPNNGQWLNATQAAQANSLGLGLHLLSDLHMGAGGGVEFARSLFHRFPTYDFGAVNAETNDGIHTMERALHEAGDINDWFQEADIADRLIFRTASFCNERSGHFDAFDQGLSFFLPNQVWLQPPGHVHAMIKNTFQPNAVQVYMDPAPSPGPYAPQSVSAQVSNDKNTLVVRYVNQAPSAMVKLTLDNFKPASSMQVWTLYGDMQGANPANQTNLIAPTMVKTDFTNGQFVTVPATSYNVFVFSSATKKDEEDVV